MQEGCSPDQPLPLAPQVLWFVLFSVNTCPSLQKYVAVSPSFVADITTMPFGGFSSLPQSTNYCNIVTEI